MDALADLLEQELEGAVEVKDKKSLHRYITLLTQNYLKKDSHETAMDRVDGELREIKSDVKLIIERMEIQQQRTDERFENLQNRMDDKFSILLQLMEERFTATQKQMDIRFDAVERRFEAVDKRFETVDKRFEDVNNRFEDVNKRFDDVNKRFDDVNKRFDDVNKRFGLMTFFMSLGFVVISLLITIVPKLF